jgi:hypothetical protein
MKRMQSIANLAAAIALLASTAVLDAKPILYATTGGGSTLVRIDVGAGTATKVTPIGPFGVAGALAIAVSPAGKLFTVTHSIPSVPGTPQLASVNPSTGLATPFGVNLESEIFMGLGFSPEGTLYGVNADSGPPNQNSLYRFDLKTGKAKMVGVPGGCGEIMDLAWYHGKMYGVTPNSLYRINLHTGQAELVTTLQGLNSVMGLAIDDDENFYVSEIIPDAPLWRVDPVTGAKTEVADVRLSYPHGLEFVPTDADDDHGQKGDRDHRDAKATFTKWVTAFPNQPGLIANMAGVVGGDVGDGVFTGEVLKMETDVVTGVTEIVAFYHFNGLKHSFSALVHVQQTGLKAVIIGVVTDGWLKGRAVEGKYTQFACDKGITGACFEGTLEIERDSNH